MGTGNNFRSKDECVVRLEEESLSWDSGLHEVSRRNLGADFNTISSPMSSQIPGQRACMSTFMKSMVFDSLQAPPPYSLNKYQHTNMFY